MYRDVTMVEITEVLRLWRDGLPKKRIAARLGLDPKTVRRDLTTAEAVGLARDAGALTDAQVRDVLLALHPAGGRPRGMAGRCAVRSRRRSSSGSGRAFG